MEVISNNSFLEDTMRMRISSRRAFNTHNGGLIMSHHKAAICGGLAALGLVAVGPQASATILTFDTPRNNNETVTNWNTYYSASPLNAYADNVNFGANATGSTPLVDG